MNRIGAFAAAILHSLALVFGRLAWQAPPWAVWLRRQGAAAASWARANPRRAVRWGLTFAALAAVAGGAWYGYSLLPKPDLVTLQVTDPPLTPYEIDNPRPAPLQIRFSASAAPLETIGKEVGAGIAVSPAVEGKWTWAEDSLLVFEPKHDWPVGQTYGVSLERSVLAQTVRLEQWGFEFKTAPFVATIRSAEFYQDPVDPTLKKAIVAVGFSHPVDPAEFEKRIVLRQQGQKEGVLGLGGETTKFSVTYDKKKLTGFVHSDPIPIPQKDSALTATVDAGVRAAKGGPGTTAPVTQQVSIPGLFSLKVSDAKAILVNNERYEPEQVLALESSATVHENELGKNVAAWLLPLYHPDKPMEEQKQAWHWGDPQQVGEALLGKSERLTLRAVPAEREFTTLHSFRYEAEVGRYLYLRVSKGVKSFGGYMLGETFDRIIRVPPFPKEVRILHSGSLLSLSGEQKVAILARDVQAVQFEIGRLLPGQIQHLVSQSGGSFGKPDFLNYNFNFDNLSERFTEVADLPPLAPGKAQYHAFDVARYLKESPENRRGLFMVKAQAWDPVNKRVVDQPDQRLILVTDLGLLAKQAVDGSQDVFVQSIASGAPLAGVRVEILGRNGLPVLALETDAEGHVRFPSLKDFTREQQPVLYVAKKGGDLSFLPMQRGDRMLDLSRFDVGGVSNAVQADKLQAYLFSDRGIYRPGEEFRIGMIVKSADWSPKLAGVPLELIVNDARGLTVKREKIKLPAGGFLETAFATEETSPTGTWTANLHIVKDGYPESMIGSLDIKVQEFQPDRLKMNARFTAESPEGWVSPDGLKARVSLQNLFGTPAANRKVRATMTLQPAYPAFSAWKDFSFHDPQRAKEGVTETLAETTTNEAGEAELDLRLQRFARATYRVHVVAQGFEAEGGRGVTAERAQLVSNLPFLVGFKPDGDLRYVNKDAKRSVDVIAIDPQAKKTTADKLTLSHVERRFVSVLTKQESGAYKYESKRKEVKLSDKPLAIPKEGTKLALPAAQPGDYALVISDAGGLELNRIEYSVAGHANLTRSLERNAELQIQLARTDYAPGEEIELQIRAPYTGSGLITVERDKVYAWRWFKADATNTVQKIKLPEGLEGNGYVSVAFVRDVNSPEIFMSPLSHGVAPFSVSLDKRRNPVTVKTPDLAKPGEPLRMKVSTQRPARLVLFAVDEGILQVARYTSPDPLGHFFQKRALDVRSSQILDLILPEFKRLIEAAASGGDAAGALGKHLNPFKRKRDKAVAWWSGIIDVGPTEKELVYNLPDYFNGTLRIMAVAVSDDAVGIFEKTAQVRGDFVISPNAPTTVAPGDEFEVSVGLANNVAGSGKQAPVSLGLKTSAQIEVLGAASQELKVDELGEGVAVFRLKAKDTLGSASLSFAASHKNKGAKYATEISVRPAVPYRTGVAFGSFSGGSEEVPTPRRMFAEHRTLQAGISHVPLLLGRGLIAYLDRFPYGCTEQLVSQALPAVILQTRPEFGYTRGQSGTAVARTVAMLRSRQNAEGAFGLWASNPNVTPLISVYAHHFLLEARERGHPVPADMLEASGNWLQGLAAAEPGDPIAAGLAGARAQAYAIYLLARQGQVVSQYAAALQKRLETDQAKEWKQDLAAAYLAGAYQLMKQERLAEGLLRDLRIGGTDSRGTGFADYYDELVRDAQVVYLIARHFPRELKRLDAAAMEALVKPLRLGSYNTLSSAYTLLALDAYASATGNDTAGKFGIAESLADGKSRALELPAGIMPKAAFSAEAAKLRFTSSSDFPAYTMVEQSGFDRALPEKEIKDGIEIHREYVDASGKPLKSLRLGEEIEVRLRIRGLRDKALQNVAIVNLLPGGFEVVPDSPAAPPEGGTAAESQPLEDGEGGEEGEADARWRPPIGGTKSTWALEYADVREDRVVLYGTVTRDAQLFVYKIKATNAGSFSVPPTYAEGMYDRSVQARGLGGRIQVERK